MKKLFQNRKYQLLIHVELRPKAQYCFMGLRPKLKGAHRDLFKEQARENNKENRGKRVKKGERRETAS